MSKNKKKRSVLGVPMIALALVAIFVALAPSEESPNKDWNPSNQPDSTPGTSVETGDHTTPSTVPNEPNEYESIERFFEIYNSDTTNPARNIKEMDIQGEDYRTEFRLKAFKDAIGLKGAVEGGTIEVVNYGIRNNDSIRIYAYVESRDAAVALVYDLIHILDKDVSDNDIANDLEYSSSILLGSKSQITGYIEDDYTDGKVAGYDVMIDCSSIGFMS